MHKYKDIVVQEYICEDVYSCESFRKTSASDTPQLRNNSKWCCEIHWKGLINRTNDKDADFLVPCFYKI